MSRPAIAITSAYSDGKIKMSPKYFDAVFKSGGIPSFLSRERDGGMIEKIIKAYDGFIFAGGVDIHPSYYGEEISHNSVEVDSERDEYEFALFSEVLRSGKPIFGICRGVQLINAALGGSLYQHIDGHGRHEDGSVRTHPVTIEADSPLYKIAGSGEAAVNSYHHQAVRRIAPGLRCAAVFTGGGEPLTEAVYLPGHKFLLGVQWHPEITFGDDPLSRGLFAEFLEACGGTGRRNSQARIV